MKTLLVWSIRGYRNYISPLFPPTCRFTPTCSQYALEAVQKFGVVKGSSLTAKRIVRCHPFNPGGYDPVPDVIWQTGQTRLEDVVTTHVDSTPDSEAE